LLKEMPLANNPHPKDLSKSLAAAGFFVSPHLSLHSSDEKIHSTISLNTGFAALPPVQNGY